MKNKTAVLFIYVMVLVFTTSCSLIDKIKGKNSSDKPTVYDVNENPVISGSNNNKFKSSVPSIYRENIETIKAEQVIITELNITLEILNIVKNKNWSGNPSDKMPVTDEELSGIDIKKYIEGERTKKTNLTIPQNLEYLYLADDSKQEIEKVIFDARNEFIEYLKFKGVNEKYISEINDYVLPGDKSRIKYFPVNDPKAPPTAAIDMEDTPRKVRLEFYAVDFYNGFTSAMESGITGKEPENPDDKQKYLKTIRDIGVRYSVYHEMTHVLQKAYVIKNTREDIDEKKKGSFWYAEKTLADIDNRYFWMWGENEIFRRDNNYVLSQESQAEGVSFEVLVEVYDLSLAQRKATWEHFAEKFHTARTKLYDIKTILESKYPALQPDEISEPVNDILYKSNQQDIGIIIERVNKLTNLPSYAGYLNPLLPQDAHKLWDALKR